MLLFSAARAEVIAPDPLSILEPSSGTIAPQAFTMASMPMVELADRLLCAE